MAKRGRKTKHGKRTQAEETAAVAAEATENTSKTSVAVPMPVESSEQSSAIRQLLEDTDEENERELKNTALREMIRKGLTIMMEPTTSEIVQRRLSTAPKIVEKVKAFDQQLAEEMLKKVFDMVEVMFVKLITKGEVSEDFSSIPLMPVNKGQGEQQCLPKKLEEWTLDQYTLLITRLTGHVTIIMLDHLMHTCNNDLANDAKLWKVGFTKPVYLLTHNLAMQAADTVYHDKFKAYLRPGERSKPFCLPGKAPPVSAPALASPTGEPSREATGSASRPSCSNQQAPATTPASKPAQSASKPQSAAAAQQSASAASRSPYSNQQASAAMPVSKPAQIASKPQSAAQQSASVAPSSPCSTKQVPAATPASKPAQTTTKLAAAQRSASAPSRTSRSNQQSSAATPASRAAQTVPKPQSAAAQQSAPVASKSPCSNQQAPVVTPASKPAPKPAQSASKPQSAAPATALAAAQQSAFVASGSVKRQKVSAAPVSTTVPPPEKPEKITMMVLEVVLSSIRDLTRMGMLPVKSNV